MASTWKVKVWPAMTTLGTLRNLKYLEIHGGLGFGVGPLELDPGPPGPGPPGPGPPGDGLGLPEPLGFTLEPTLGQGWQTP